MTGTLEGTANQTNVDHDFDGGTAPITINQVFLTAGDLRLAGRAQFAIVKQSAGVDTDGNGTADLLNATVLSIGLQLTDAGAAEQGRAALNFEKVQPASFTADGAAILACIDWIAHGVEIVQSHFPGWKRKIPFLPA